MNCLICGDIQEINIEGDIGADPVWCHHCGCNLDIEDLPVSAKLIKELVQWAAEYGNWIDWDVDQLRPGGLELETRFNQKGLLLSEEVQQELGEEFTIRFIDSNHSVIYANHL
ncbi:hypothetical protein [Jeotgalibacillus sp. R-1-5s-1]|uniref:hypothetical protein n=1 Tax=Jeotgalibacillus sp. R-1-5s-1 TaxID=2555897 RepID=UPI001069E5A0|nr:hypothetical protein [Jeotgalibacillus sp. R-1-5s-1]TFD94394.1 hypothetical protein E2491_13205 [Jeotgalibacillus sp. R-1-5s-1]